MAFTDDAVRSKLSALNETQEGIVTVAQWIMFHRRHADRTAQLWMQRLKDANPSKKLNLIYLANEVVQQSKMRKKTEFLSAYSPIIAEATTAAYKGASSDVQQKIRRVIEVWRQRQIFELPIQEAIEKQVDEVDRNRSSNRKAALGGSLFSSGSSVPTDLQPLVPLSTALSKTDIHAQPTVATANQEYEKLTNPANPIPTPPLHAAKLATLLKTLANAEGAVAESIKARQSLISGLEKLLDTNKAALTKEEEQRAALASKKVIIETRKREVEDAIMRGLSGDEAAAISSAPLPTVPAPTSAEPPRPDIEELTPPPMESFTPVGSPQHESSTTDTNTNTFSAPFDPSSVPLPLSTPSTNFNAPSAPHLPGADLLASLTQHNRSDSTNGHSYTTGPSSAKKRKMSRSAAEDEFAAFADDGDMENIDADVAGLLERKGSNEYV